MGDYQFAIDKKDGVITFIEVRNPEKNFSVTRNFIKGKGKDEEYYQVGLFASMYSFDTDPEGVIVKHVKPEDWPERFNNNDIREAVSFLRNKYKELTSQEYQVAYDEFKAITHAMILDGINNSPIEKFKDKGFTVGIQFYNEAINLTKDLLYRGVIDSQKDTSILPYLDRDIDNALMFGIMSRQEKTNINYQFKYDLNNNDTRISYVSVKNLDKDFRVSRMIYEGEKESYEVGSSSAFGTFARVHSFDIAPSGIISDRINVHYWPKQITHDDINQAVRFLRSQYQDLLQKRQKEATMRKEKNVADIFKGASNELPTPTIFQNNKPKSYLAKPEGLPDLKKLSRTDREEMNMFCNNFLDSFPSANLPELIKLSPIGHQMTKYGVQNANGLIDTNQYDQLTKKQEQEIKEILKPYPGIGIRLDYECTGAAIKLEMPNGMTLNVPEFTSRKLSAGKALEL